MPAEIPTTKPEAIFALFENGLGVLEVAGQGHPVAEVLKAWRQWSKKAISAQRRMEARK